MAEFLPSKFSYGATEEEAGSADYTSIAAAFRELFGIGRSERVSASVICSDAEANRKKAETSMWPASIYYADLARKKQADCDARMGVAAEEQQTALLNTALRVGALIGLVGLGAVAYTVVARNMAEVRRLNAAIAVRQAEKAEGL